MSESTPRTDAFAHSIKAVPWSGNETQQVMGAVLAIFVQWREWAEGLERELVAANGLGVPVTVRNQYANQEQAAITRAIEGAASETHRAKSALAKSAQEAAVAKPYSPEMRSSAPN